MASLKESVDSKMFLNKKKEINDEDNNDNKHEEVNNTNEAISFQNNHSLESESTQQYTPSQAKMKLKLLHKELAQYAQKKLLNVAVKKFQWAIRKGLPVNIHTYANMLNAYVRCGDMEGDHLS